MTSQFDLSDIETATLGHFLESGFMSPALQGLLPGRTVFGPALTVRMLGDDGAMLRHCPQQNPDRSSSSIVAAIFAMPVGARSRPQPLRLAAWWGP